jgi:glycine oxidase
MRSQVVLFRRQPSFLSRIVVASDHYLIPGRDGHVLVGSTAKDVGFDKSTANQRLHPTALTLMPGLKDGSIERHGAGLRPASADGVPFIGEHRDIAGLYVCTGHFGNGLGMGRHQQS